MEGLNMKHLFVAVDGTETIVDYTEEEINIAEKNKKDDFIELAKQIKEAEEKAAAREAILNRLGITVDEAATLLG
jgi:cell division ATPase FtsA